MLRFICLAAVFALSASLVVQDFTITSDDEVDGFYTMAVFCYDKNPPGDESHSGTYSITLSADDSVSFENLLLLQYDDQGDSFNQIFNVNTGKYKDMTCAERVTFAKTSKIAVPGQTYESFAQDNFGHPKFWYFAVADCEGGTLEGLTVSAHLLNDQQTGSFNEEFGTNEQGLQTLYLLFLMVYTIGFPVAGFFYHKAQGEDENHQFVKIFGAVVFFKYLMVLLYFVHFISFSGNGIGFSGLAFVAEGLDMLARVLFAAILMFLSEGWTISETTLSQTSKVAIMGSLSLLFVVSVGLILWEFFASSPEMIHPPLAQQAFNDIFMGFWAFFAVWFFIRCIQSMRRLNENEEGNKSKKILFIVLAIVYGFGILSLPVFTYIQGLLDPWVRTYVSHVVNIVITTLGYGVFVAIIWPTHAKDFFKPPSLTAAAGAADAAYSQL